MTPQNTRKDKNFFTVAYKIKEIFYSLQGEGFFSGQPAVFCRFSGCNLWSGKKKDQHQAVCGFCDTDFSGTDGENGGIYESPHVLARKMAELWPQGSPKQRFAVCTGGEPLLQLDDALINALHEFKFFIAVETNGTIPAPRGVDWICVSPKAKAKLVQQKGNELKLVYPQENDDPENYIHLDFKHFFLQPLHGESYTQNLQTTLKYLWNHPHWRLSLQLQKILRIR